MKILHIVSNLPKASGVSVFLGEIAAGQVELGHEVSAFVKDLEQDHYPIDSKIKIVGEDALVSGFDVVHLHGLWDPWLTRMSKRAHGSGSKVVWSPHGMLTPWALKNKLIKKVLGLVLYQWRSLSAADLIHVTAESEREDVLRLHLKNPVVIAPLGTDLSSPSSPSTSTSPSPSPSPKTLLFVSRVQRKKGLVNLLNAWAKLPDEVKRDWRIRIVGPDEDGHLDTLVELCKKLHLRYSDNCARRSRVDGSHSETGVDTQVERNSACDEVASVIDFVGPKFEEELTQEYAQADLFVLPTFSENFGSVVIESLAQGVPVICTKGAPWQELETHHCGWWIDIGVDPLVAALKTAFATPQAEIDIMGSNGRKLVEEKYTWRAVAQKVLMGYEEIRK